MFSVVILTFNEEKNIRKCISSVKKFSNDIVVLDSFSTDNTETIAKELGVRVVKNKFNGYASQRNFALDGINFQHSFLMMLDADERLTESLGNEILNSLYSSPQAAMFLCRRKDYFQNGWLKRSSGYPTWFPRVFKIGYCRVHREINEEYVCEGETVNLRSHLNHYPFNKGLNEWFSKHNRYSDMEAELLCSGNNRLSIKGLFSQDPLIRRKNLKSFIYKLPGRPLIVFIIFYFIKLGFLDGKAGFRFCLLKLIYELMISLKASEIRRLKK
ncbi:TPA: glycosyltransferase family 2 protein [Vibrio parahaemolyticus]